MKFGSKTTEKRTSTSSGGGGNFIKYFRKGETRVRFLQEMNPDEDKWGGWTVFYDHFSPSASRSYPCTGDRQTCPGCTSSNPKESSASRRYLVNLLDQGTGYVDLWKVPTSLIDDLIRYAEKSGGTITDRDYTVVQYKGDDDKVKYSVDREEKDPIELSLYEDKFRDHEKALAEAFIEVWGELPEDTEAEAPQVKPAKKAAAKKPVQSKEDWDKIENGPIPSEPAAEEATSEQAPLPAEPEEEDETEISESELRKMEPDEIKKLFVQCGLEVPDSDDSNVLADLLMEALG